MRLTFSRKFRLEVVKEILDIIDQKRQATGNSNACADVEQYVLERELRDLEKASHAEEEALS